MSAQQDHNCHDRQPFWTVQAVFDPDGGGAEFAYTIGLHDCGLPELHMWGRPDRGEDPGEDWVFSIDDRCRILNEFAWLLVDGRLATGQECTKEYDAGEVVVHFRVGQPGRCLDLEAFGTHPEATIWPLNWSLSRPPEGISKPLDRQAREVARHEFSQIAASVSPIERALLPSEWSLPSRPSFTIDQRFGPRTPIVLARATELAQASVNELNNLMHAAINVDMHGSLSFPVSVARAAARRSGRRPAMEELASSVQSLVAWLASAPNNRSRWSELLESLYGSDMATPEGRDLAHRESMRLLHDAALGCMAVEVVADVMPEEWLVAGRGPWLGALHRPAGELPGPEYAASAQVLAVVTELLRPLSSQQLAQIATLHRFARDGRVDGWQDYHDVFARLHGWSMLGAAACPWDPTLSRLPAWTDVVAGTGYRRDQVSLMPLFELQEWASCVTAAVTHRGRLTAEHVEAFTEPFVDLVPRLSMTLNAPIARAS